MKKILIPKIALIVLDLSPVNNIEMIKIIENKTIKQFLLSLNSFNKKPIIIKKNPFKYPPTIGSSLKKLTIL